MNETDTETVAEVFCEWEGGRFPSDQFDRDATYGLVHARPPGANTPKHTVTGDRVPAEIRSSGGGGGGGGGIMIGGVYHGPLLGPNKG